MIRNVKELSFDFQVKRYKKGVIVFDFSLEISLPGYRIIFLII